MSYRYLTRSYVQFLGLEVIPVLAHRTSTARAWIDDVVPRPAQRYDVGVRHEGHLYIRDEDGLAWTRSSYDDVMDRQRRGLQKTGRIPEVFL